MTRYTPYESDAAFAAVAVNLFTSHPSLVADYVGCEETVIRKIATGKWTTPPRSRDRRDLSENASRDTPVPTLDGFWSYLRGRFEAQVEETYERYRHPATRSAQPTKADLLEGLRALPPEERLATLTEMFDAL